MIKDYTPVAVIAAILGFILVIISKISIFESIQINSICMGVGAALAVLGIAHPVGKYYAKIVTKMVFSPELRESSLREENDERNIRVREKAGWNTTRITFNILLFLTVASAFMNLGPDVTILFASLIVIESSLVTGSLIYYEKRM